MPVCVTSEIGKLRRVLLHRPGRELEHLVPDEMERLLFDDIPYLKTAQAEHDAFADTLRSQGVDVVYLEDLMAETLETVPECREAFVRQFVQEGGSSALSYQEELARYLMDIPSAKDMVCKTMSGVSSEELGLRRRQPLAEMVQKSHHFLLDPIPNLYFTRDPFASIGRGVSLNHMYSVTRKRETIYGKFILENHPDYAPGMHFWYHREDPYRIEGGDILNLSRHVIAVGISQRTMPEAIELLADNLFMDENSEIDTILALDIPNLRAYMHLDTVCTQLDRETFLVHPGILGSLRIFVITPGRDGERISVKESEEPLTSVLASLLEVDHVSMIKCGGSDKVASEREQWNDGSNTLCIAPGTVIAYDRNHITNELMRENGIEVLEIPSSELSRGRGGPRCMSMPLWRDNM